MIPKREQRRRVKGYRQPDNCRYVGRNTQWGNPYKVGSLLGNVAFVITKQAGYVNLPIDTIITPQMAVDLYRVWLEREMAVFKKFGQDFLGPLRQYEYLSCFCQLSTVCHVDVIIQELSK